MDSDTTHLEQRLARQAELLRQLGNSKRMLICTILSHGEWNVKSLAVRVGLSQSALSQHLTRLRQSGLVSVRYEAQQRYYSCAHRDALRILQAVHEIFDLDPAPAVHPLPDGQDAAAEHHAGL
ncbi:winged helix-turn-helix transcriptional regulator [Ochrobactrum sp. XJ1]|nr:winged helix-turn-helix transcriptional regulator [Ochrobactrum sp. XJ1]